MQSGDHRLADSRLLRWAVAASILGGSAVVITILVLRAIPGQATAQVEIAGWRAPVGVVVSTDNVRSHLPGIVVGSLFRDAPTVEINAGRVEQASGDAVTVRTWTGGKTIRYGIGAGTRVIDARHPLGAAAVSEGEDVAVITGPGSDDALAVLTNVTRARD